MYSHVFRLFTFKIVQYISTILLLSYHSSMRIICVTHTLLLPLVEIIYYNSNKPKNVLKYTINGFISYLIIIMLLCLKCVYVTK